MSVIIKGVIEFRDTQDKKGPSGQISKIVSG
jgi:hypothetical protein